MHLNFFFSIFAENFVLLSRNIIKLIPFGAWNTKYKKSAISIWLYKGALSRNSLISRVTVVIYLLQWLHVLLAYRTRSTKHGLALGHLYLKEYSVILITSLCDINLKILEKKKVISKIAVDSNFPFARCMIMYISTAP